MKSLATLQGICHQPFFRDGLAIEAQRGGVLSQGHRPWSPAGGVSPRPPGRVDFQLSVVFCPFATGRPLTRNLR